MTNGSCRSVFQHLDMRISRFHYGMSCGLCRALNVSPTYRINIPFPLLSLHFLSLFVFLRMSVNTHDNSSSTQSIVGAHYRVGKKIGEGCFGVIFEGPSPHSPTSTPRILPNLAPYRRSKPAQLSKRGHQVRERRSFVAVA